MSDIFAVYFPLWQGEAQIKCIADTTTLNSLETLRQTQKQVNADLGSEGHHGWTPTADFQILPRLGSHISVLHKELVQ
jgi:hypothetical protein